MNSKIKIFWPWELPEKIDGIAVVVDVLAATSNIAWFLAHEAGELIIINSKNVDEVRNRYKEAVTIGESLDPRLQGYFYASNSPSKIEKVDVSGKSVLYMSNNGSRVIEEVINKKAVKVITASFTNFSSVVNYLKLLDGETITFIPAGEISLPESIPDKKSKDDLICAGCLKDTLLGKETGWENVFKELKKYILSHYDFNPKVREEDLAIITRFNSNPVVPACYKGEDGFIHVRNAPLET